MQESSKYHKQTKSLFKAFYHAVCGLRIAFKDDKAFRQETLLTIVIIPIALILGATAIEKAILISCWFMVLIAEAINSSIEAIVDRISLEVHPLSKKIKDISSGAVLVAIINTIVVWMIIILSHFW